MTDLNFYINVKEVMLRRFLPRPKPRNRSVSVLVGVDEWLPLIDGDTGVCFK